MASIEEVVQRLKESKPPATDHFTYLTIVENSLSPEILPALRDILDDAELTSEVGWDMVEMLIAMPGSGECLERVARLGNPREVILKVLEVLDAQASRRAEDPTGEDGELDEEAVNRIVTLIGMLGVLHRRLRVKAPSRFVHTTLSTVLEAYDPQSPAITAAVVDLVRSLSGRKRPPLPTRQSSTKLETPFMEAGASGSQPGAPDPEAQDQEQRPDEQEEVLTTRLLQAFVLEIIERFANGGPTGWAGRLVEYIWPERLVPGRVTMMQLFKQDQKLLAKDALMGQLVAIAGDLGLAKIPHDKVRAILEAPIARNTLSVDLADAQHVESIKLPTGGLICLIAYWMFAADVFDAHYASLSLSLLTDHKALLQRFLEGNPQEAIASSPGTVEALVTIAVRVAGHDGITGATAAAADADADGKSQYMQYHHLLTLISVFHPEVRVRNAATLLAGHVLHADPDPHDRLVILEDLLENCMFSTLQACAVTWLREELLSARKAREASSSSSGAGSANEATSPFSTSEAVEKLQYALFPSLAHLDDAAAVSVNELWEFWTQESSFHLQAANFTVFLFRGEAWAEQTPEGMKAAVGERYVEPLREVVKRLLGDGGSEAGGDVRMELEVLEETLKSVAWQ